MLSIVTPSLNQREHLARCLREMAALGSDVEHVVVDGNSSDGSGELLRDHPAAMVEDDRGLYDAVNKGVHRAAGDLLGYISCDDSILPWTPSLVRAHFTSDPDLELLVGDAVELTGPRAAFVIQPPAPWLALHLQSGRLLPQPAVFFRRSLFERLGGFDASFELLGDHDFFTRAVASGARVARAWEILSVQRVVEGQLMQRHAARAKEEATRITRRRGWAPPTAPHRGAARGLQAALHRGAMAAILTGALAGRTPWRRAARSGYFKLASTRALIASMVGTSRHRVIVELTESGRRALGLE